MVHIKRLKNYLFSLSLSLSFFKKQCFFSRHKFFCLFYFSIFRTLYILKQVFWGRNLISIFLASQNRYHTNTEVSQIWMKKKKKLLTQRMFLHIKILIYMAMILGFVFFLTSEVTIFLCLFKQTMHQKNVLGKIYVLLQINIVSKLFNNHIVYWMSKN